MQSKIYGSNIVITESISSQLKSLSQVKSVKKYELSEEIPYKGAKTMYLVDVEDQDLLKEIVLNTCKGLKNSLK